MRTDGFTVSGFHGVHGYGTCGHVHRTVAAAASCLRAEDARLRALREAAREAYLTRCFSARSVSRVVDGRVCELTDEQHERYLACCS